MTRMTRGRFTCHLHGLHSAGLLKKAEANTKCRPGNAGEAKPGADWQANNKSPNECLDELFKRSTRAKA